MHSDIYWINAPGHGRLAIMARPRAGDWLPDEISSWKEQGVGAVVCLLEREEIEQLELREEAGLCRNSGIEFITFPIADRGLPPNVRGFAELVRSLRARLDKGTRVAIHCRAGIGRSSVVAACVLRAYGFTTADAFELIAKARGCAVPDTDQQRDWVESFIS